MRIILVVPEIPTGTPAVTTTRSPCFTSPASWADWMARSTSWSVLLARGMVMGTSPQYRAIWRWTWGSSSRATTVAAGRKRLTIWAVMPRWLTVRMASAPMSSAVVQAAWAVAAVMDSRVRLGVLVGQMRSMLLSVLRAMASIV